MTVKAAACESNYIVKVSRAKMPSSCKARYSDVAVIEVDPGVETVSMISERARGVRRIVKAWRRLHAVGANCAAVQARREAEELCAKLRSARDNYNAKIDVYRVAEHSHSEAWEKYKAGLIDDNAFLAKRIARNAALDACDKAELALTSLLTNN